MSKTKIQSIVINIGGNDIALTIEQAKELQVLLNDTFGKAPVILPNVITVPVAPDPYRPPYRYWDVGWTYTSSKTTIGDGTVPTYTLKHREP